MLIQKNTLNRETTLSLILNTNYKENKLAGKGLYMAVMTYLYRDRSNYKCFNVVKLKGDLPTHEDRKVIKKALDCGEYFIPEQIGLPLIREWEFNEADDHSWCEFDPDTGFTDDNCHGLFDIQDYSNLTVQEVVEAFRKIAAGEDRWDEW